MDNKKIEDCLSIAIEQYKPYFDEKFHWIWLELSHIMKDLEETKEQTKKTNWRVNKLEDEVKVREWINKKNKKIWNILAWVAWTWVTLFAAIWYLFILISK